MCVRDDNVYYSANSATGADNVDNCNFSMCVCMYILKKTQEASMVLADARHHANKENSGRTPAELCLCCISLCMYVSCRRQAAGACEGEMSMILERDRMFII